jgi:hypothetical protein
MTLALALVVRLLPGEWGRAMLAELAILEDPKARRRFALGCMAAVLARPAAWLRGAALVLVAYAPVLVLTGRAGHGNVVAVLAIAICFYAVAGVQTPGVATGTGAGALVWWLALLASATVRSHPQWALIVIAAAVVYAGWRGGTLAALGTASATCLAIFAVSVGTYAALPRLAPDIAPANATDPLLENRIESTDPYVGELLLSALLATALIGAARGERRLPG